MYAQAGLRNQSVVCVSVYQSDISFLGSYSKSVDLLQGLLHFQFLQYAKMEQAIKNLRYRRPGN